MCLQFVPKGLEKCGYTNADFSWNRYNKAMGFNSGQYTQSGVICNQ